MDGLVGFVVLCSGLAAPILTMWAVVGLYTQQPTCKCPLPKFLFFLALLIVSGLTIRTVVVDDGRWLTQASSLGVLIVAGAMRRPSEHDDAAESAASTLLTN